MRVFKRSDWNIWWTLTLASALFTFIVLILEALGAFRDLGIVVGGGGVLLAILFGLSASTRASLSQFRGEALPRFDDMISRLDDVALRVTDVASRVDLVASRVDLVASRVDGVGSRLDRIAAILEERLPRASGIGSVSPAMRVS
jgi:hypothetical protein